MKFSVRSYYNNLEYKVENFWDLDPYVCTYIVKNHCEFRQDPFIHT